MSLHRNKISTRITKSIIEIKYTITDSNEKKKKKKLNIIIK